VVPLAFGFGAIDGESLVAKVLKVPSLTPCYAYIAVQIPQKTAAVGLGIVSVFYLMWVFKNVFWWTLFSSGFLVFMHALFRDASMHKDMEDAVLMEGELNEDAAFLNA
jgi:hypothetical protein